MKYQKITNLVDNKPSQPYKFRIKRWVEINNDSRRTCKTNSQIRYKTLMLNWSLIEAYFTYFLKGL